MSIFVGSAAKKYAVCWLWICTFLMLFSNNSLFWFSQQQWKINEWVRQGWKENWKMWVLGFFCELISKLNNGEKKRSFLFFILNWFQRQKRLYLKLLVCFFCFCSSIFDGLSLKTLTSCRNKRFQEFLNMS